MNIRDSEKAWSALLMVLLLWVLVLFCQATCMGIAEYRVAHENAAVAR